MDPDAKVTARGRCSGMRDGRVAISQPCVARYRFENGRIVEMWSTRSNYAFMCGDASGVRPGIRATSCCAPSGRGCAFLGSICWRAHGLSRSPCRRRASRTRCWPATEWSDVAAADRAGGSMPRPSCIERRYPLDSIQRDTRLARGQVPMNQGPAELRAGPFCVLSSRTCGHTHREGFDHEHVVSVRCSSALRTQHNTIQ